MGQTIGYVRVSTYDQKPDRQIAEIEARTSKIFTDYSSGKSMDRPQLAAMMDYVREGDTIVVHSMDRLARNAIDLRKMVSELTNQGICIEFIQEKLIFVKDEKNPMATFLMSVMGAFAELERAMIKERQREGIALAKKRGVYKGRSKALSEEQVSEAKKQLANGVSKTQIARDLNISRETLYRYLKSSRSDAPG